MTTTTFGKRGLAQPSASASARFQAATATPGRMPAAPSASRDDAQAQRPKSLIDHVPLMTFAIIAALLVIFYGLEKRYAFSIGRNGEIDLESLVAFGGASYRRVAGGGEWWRVFLAPLLHASPSHVIGNSIAMLLVGFRLEAIIGRAWIAAIFAVSALGGAAGSLLGNPHYITTVGASGAITGLVGALFVASFHCASDSAQLRRMLWTSALLGVPALGPLAYGAVGHTDYFCHSGGAVAGAALMFAVLGLWSENYVRPKFQGWAALAAASGVVAALGSSAFAANRFAAEAAQAQRFIPGAELPDSTSGDPRKASEFLQRYPLDPRSHIAEAMVYLKGSSLTQGNLSGAESELRRALALEAPDEIRQPVLPFATTLLGVVVSEQGRRDEARTIVAEECRDRAAMAAPLVQILDKYRLCD